MQTENKNRPPAWLVLLALVGATAAVFSPVVTFEATDYDDANYVFENPAVMSGLTADGVKWAFTTGHAANWHPLTWLSHMADVEMFGPNAGGHHLVNLTLHCANVALVFLLFRRLTGALWRSAFVAALFGWHPLHVESVTWIAERKDVLSAFFGLLSLWAYAGYAEKSESRKLKAEMGASRSGSFWLALGLFALGLMSKPMLVTLPVVMLLLDFWPLQRFQFSAFSFQLFRSCLREKLPFFALAVASGIITLLAQSHGGAVRSLQNFSFGERMANAVVSFALYLGKSFWPAKLAAFYPMPEHHATGAVALTTVLLIGVTAWTIWIASRAPHRVVGWLWFAIMLLPVIGLVQVGMQQMADRYTYLPLIGIFVLIAWEAAALAGRFPMMKPLLAALAAAVIAACSVVTWKQVAHWRNSEKLFRHALAVTEKNYLAHNNLGYHLFTQGKVAEAIAEYEAALEINPTYTDAHSNLGRALAAQERHAEAATHFEAVLQLLPDDVIAHNNLGNVLALLGRHEEAITHFRAALTAKPDHAAAQNNWALSAEELGRPAEAVEHYRDALRINPDFTAALNNLAWILATHPDAKLRDGAAAVELAERACRLTGHGQPLPLLTLAAASAEAGQLAEAIALATRARELAANASDHSLTQRSDTMLKQFNAGEPYRTGRAEAP
ncbi:MAG: tetratricopeptide repeat protein [Pedosphaera sp.]|nr:tetratricopeptide repeat protein [Pedosphaera sp.]